MKVYIGERANKNAGGMARVAEGLYKHLPCEIVSDIEKADVVNPHISLWWNVPQGMPIVLSNHGLYWSEHGWGDHGTKSNPNVLLPMYQADVVTVPSDFVHNVIARQTLIDAKVVRHGIEVDEWLPGENNGAH